MARQATPPAAAVIQPRADPAKQYAAIADAIQRENDKLGRSLAASHVPAERFFAVVDQALRRSPALLSCTPASIVRALLDAAELGLVPSGLLGSAYLVPYRNKRSGRLEAQLIPGYRGLIDLARRSGELRQIEARVVRERDDFDIVFGTDGKVLHRPFINRGEREPILDTQTGLPRLDPVTGGPETKLADAGSFVGVYCIARLAHGAEHVEWMSWTEVEAVRRRSKAADDGPWVTDPAEMAKKTITRRTVKYLPLAIDSPVIRALELEDRAEAEAEERRATSAPARNALHAALGLVALSEGTAAADAAPSPESDGQAACGEAAPDGSGACAKVGGHDGPHANDEAVWPVGGDAAGE